MLIAVIIAVVITLFFTLSHLRNLKKIEKKALESAEKGKLISGGPQSQHPHIDNAQCIGCGTCTMVCPEGDVLAVLGGKAVIVNGYKCIGHGLCADACPVGAITMVMATPSMGAERSRPVTQPPGSTARAASRLTAPLPHPTSRTRSPGSRTAAVRRRRPKGASMVSKRSASVTQTSAGRPFQYSTMSMFAMSHF